MLLAASGARVTVIERDREVGGRTTTIEQDGFRFDRGPTFFLYPQVLQAIFEDAGYDLYEEVEMARIDPNYRLLFEGGGSIDASSDIGKLKAEIARLNPRDAAGVDAYFADNRRKFEAFRPILESPFQRHADLLRLPLAKLLPLARPWSSVDRDLGRYFEDPRVRLAFSFQSKYLGMSPFKCPSLFTILAFIEYEFGVFHPVGGCGAVSRAMRRVAERLGVSFVLGEPVRELIFEGRCVRGVRTERSEYRADALVMNADFASAMRDLVPDRLRRRWTDRKLAGRKMSCSTFMLYLGIDGRYDELSHHTIFLSKDYEQNLADIEHYRVPRDPSVYVHNPSIVDPTLAPAGMSSLYVLAPVSHAHPDLDWGAERDSFRERVLGQLGKMGLGDLRERIRTEIVYTPADWETGMNLYKGATFSLAHSLDQMLSFRPRNRFEDLEGVYLTGGGTHPGSGLPVIFQSARIATELLLADLGLARGPRTEVSAPRWPRLAGGAA